MNNDRELLDLAAKAAGIEWCHIEGLCPNGGYWKFSDGKTQAWWNPLTDDGDALRLAVKLEMQMVIGYRRIEACIASDSESEPILAYENKVGDLYAATRRAIVRAAAEIGNGMK